MAKNAVIVGAPRRGTDVFAGIFARAGCRVGPPGDAARPTLDDRPTPSSEGSEELVERNVEVLQRAGFPHDDTWTDASVPPDRAAAIWELDPSDDDRRFVRRHPEEAPWLWEDPRLCFTLPYWWPMMDGDRTRVLLVSGELASGDAGRGSARAAKISADLAEQHLAAARRAVDRLDVPHLDLGPADLEREPREAARRLGETFGLDLSSADLEAARAGDA